MLHPERERERSVKVYYCGREDCEKGHFFGPAVRSHQLIHFVLKGKGIYRTEYGEYEIKEGEAFLIRPDVLPGGSGGTVELRVDCI